jgi:hypothetical protein
MVLGKKATPLFKILPFLSKERELVGKDKIGAGKASPKKSSGA